MESEHAQEFTEALGQVLAGAVRLTDVAADLGVPQALGLTPAEWTERRLAGAVRLSIPERRAVVAELTERGMSQREIADALDVGLATVNRDLVGVPNGTPTDAESAPERESDSAVVPDGTAEGVEYKLDTTSWSEDELRLRDLLLDGVTIVVNLRAHGGLIDWAMQRDAFVRVDRQTAWGNPFILGDESDGGDGDRDAVVDAYREHYLPHKRSLIARLQNGELEGKALGCWCAPERCHADVLADWYEG